MTLNKLAQAPKLYLWGIVPVILAASMLVVFMLFEGGQVKDKTSSPAGGDFVLQSDNGPVALADYRGKIVIVYFGYAFCPDICPTSLGLLSLALRKLSDNELNQVQPIFISVDPERDTVERLKTYAGAFHPKIIGLTGNPVDIASVAQNYGAVYMKVEMPDSAMGYAVDHSSKYYLIDRSGVLSQEIMHGTDPEEIARIIKVALQS